jgi:IS605 OrfB family transposase
MITVYRYRVKSLNGLLNKQARAVNYVFNYCNDVQKQALKWGKRWPTGFDFNKLTAGSGKELGLHSGTVNAICEQYAKSRSQKKKPYLRWRSKKSLGWIPLKGRDLKREGEAFRFAGNTFRVFNSRALPNGKIKDGTNFSQDSRGNWFLNIVVEIDDVAPRQINKGVGIDLGLKDFATLSTGEKIEAQRIYRRAEQSLAVAQRANKKRRVSAIHAKIKNQRLDFHHKLSTRLVREFDYIAVGNVCAKGLAKTNLAKSVLDAGWSSFRNQLRYKAIAHGAKVEEVSERFTTQTCHECGSIAGPKGQTGLNERNWICGDCGCSHDRDVNAAINILFRGYGHVAPVQGIPVL